MIMNNLIPPWSAYETRQSAISNGRMLLTSAFAALVKCRTGFTAFELLDIFTAPPDEGENDAARDLVCLDAEYFARALVTGQLESFARPIGGGLFRPIEMYKWELDEPIHRFATGALNIEEWADSLTPHSHLIFVSTVQFDRWLAELEVPSALTNRQIEEIVDPQIRSKRRSGASKIDDIESNEKMVGRDSSDPAKMLSVGPVLLKLTEVIDLTNRSRSTIYNLEKNGEFPKRVKLGSSSRWRKDEVINWLEDKFLERSK